MALELVAQKSENRNGHGIDGTEVGEAGGFPKSVFSLQNVKSLKV